MRKFGSLTVLSALVFISSCAGVRIGRPSPLEIAASFEAAGNPDEAVKTLKNASQDASYKSAVKREMLTALAELYANQKDNLNAIKTLREAAKTGDGDPFIGLRLGEMLLREGLIVEATAEFTALENRGVKTPSLLLGLGEAYYRNGRTLKATGYLEQYLKIYPDDKKAMMMLYESHEAMGNYPAARNALSGCAAVLSVKDFTVKMAMNWMRDGNPDEAIEELEKIKADFPESNFYLALACYQKGDLDKALNFFARAPDSLAEEASFFRALVLFELGRKAEAYPIFKKLALKENYSRYCAVFVK